MAKIRVLDRVARCMQRLGYLKHLVRRVVAFETSSLHHLGRDLVGIVMRRVSVPLANDLAAYARARLTDRVYNGLKRQVANWTEGQDTLALMELQDLYLADPSLPSQTGKLVQDDWRRYPPLGTALGLIRSGTYSPNTRALSLLSVTPDAELHAFREYDAVANPFRLSRAQALLLLYASLENDGEAMAPLLTRLGADPGREFTDRDAGALLAEVYRQVVRNHNRGLLPAKARERLEILSRIAASIGNWRDRAYSGGGAHVNNGRPRVEPYVDLGLLAKPDSFRYSYTLSPMGFIWSRALQNVETSQQVGVFLSRRFFATAASAYGLSTAVAPEAGQMVAILYEAWQAMRIATGYAPIDEVALLAGIRGLLDRGLVIEIAVARDALIAYQRSHPYQLSFSVNRMGALAHVRFLAAPEVESKEPS